MSSKAMSLKAKIRNLAKEKKVSAQVILQNYMFECFLERLSKSAYRDKFILKGGMLITALVGINNRSTMDMDTTLIDFPLSMESITEAIGKICKIVIEDNITFSILNIEAIRNDDDYGGYRVNLKGVYDTIITPLHIDITAGDTITPKEVSYQYQKMFNNQKIDILAYNIETILAEKYETILRRSEFNTRARDFYDIYILVKTQTYSSELFIAAVRKTAEKRNSLFILENTGTIIGELKTSSNLVTQWNKYRRSFAYAKEITWEEITLSLDTVSSPFLQHRGTRHRTPITLII
jgi:predicted nucleotidyltransferase component of viral defense system